MGLMRASGYLGIDEVIEIGEDDLVDPVTRDRAGMVMSNCRLASRPMIRSGP